MFLGINGRAEFALKFAFANEWAITISKLDCEHYAYVIAPAYSFEPEFYEDTPANIRQKIAKLDREANERGDQNRHYAATDDEIFALIESVKKRPAYLADVANEMLTKILKK